MVYKNRSQTINAVCVIPSVLYIYIILTLAIQIQPLLIYDPQHKNCSQHKPADPSYNNRSARTHTRGQMIHNKSNTVNTGCKPIPVSGLCPSCVRSDWRTTSNLPHVPSQQMYTHHALVSNIHYCPQHVACWLTHSQYALCTHTVYSVHQHQMMPFSSAAGLGWTSSDSVCWLSFNSLILGTVCVCVCMCSWVPFCSCRWSLLVPSVIRSL